MTSAPGSGDLLVVSQSSNHALNCPKTQMQAWANVMRSFLKNKRMALRVPVHYYSKKAGKFTARWVPISAFGPLDISYFGFRTPVTTVQGAGSAKSEILRFPWLSMGISQE